MMLRTLLFSLALAFGLAGSPVDAQVVTQSTATLPSGSWTSLGAGPLLLAASGGEASYAIADTTPSVAATTFFLPLGAPAVSVLTTSNVWVKSVSSARPSVVYYAPVTASGGGGSFTWPGSAAVSSYGTAPSGTVPAVNAYVTNTPANVALETGGNLAALVANSLLSIPAGSNVIGSIGNISFGAAASPVTTNPTSTLTLTSTTTAYSAGQLIANNATAGSVTVPSFAIANSAGGAIIPRLRLSTNDATSTAWGAQTIQVDLWLAAPTFSNGDRGTWSIATGSANHLGSFACTMSSEYGDGAYAECSPAVGNGVMPKLASGTSVYWTLNAKTGSGVTGASKAFTLTAEELN